METAPQAEIAAQPAPAQTTEATPSPAPAVTSAETTPPSYFDASAFDTLLGYSEEAPSASTPSPAATVATPASTEAPASDAPATPAEATPAGDNPPPAEAPTETATATETASAEAATSETAPSTEKILPNRISTGQFSDVEQRAIAKRKALRDSGEDVPLKECIEIIETQDRQARDAAATAQAEIDATPDPLAAQEQEIADIRAKLAEAGEAGSLMTPEVAQLQGDLAEKVADFKLAQYRREQEAANASAVVQTSERANFEASRDRAYAEYPSAQDGDSVLGMALAAEVAQWKAENRPEANAPNSCELVVASAAQRAARAIAKDKGITFEQALSSLKAKSPATPAASTTAAAPTPAAPRPAAGIVSTAPGNRSLVEPAPAPTTKDLVKQSLTNPSVADEALGYGSGTGLFR